MLYYFRHEHHHPRSLAPLFEWVPPLLDRLSGWIPDVEAGWVKYVVGFVVSIAVRETRRRKRIAQETSTEVEDAK